jgi:hypothetical protein
MFTQSISNAAVTVRTTVEAVLSPICINISSSNQLCRIIVPGETLENRQGGQLIFQPSPGRKLILDDISVNEVDSCGSNIQNSDFESGLPPGLRYNGTCVIDTTRSYSGVRSLRYEATTSDDLVIPVAPCELSAGQFNINYYVYTSGALNASLNVAVASAIEASNVPVSVNCAATSTNDFQHCTLSFAAQKRSVSDPNFKGGHQLEIRFKLVGASSAVFWLDDIAVSFTPAAK